MFTAGVRAHLTASRLAVPLTLPRGRGLVVSTTANVGALAQEYGVTDTNGTQPPPFRMPERQ